MPSAVRAGLEFLSREDSVHRKFDLPFSEAVRAGDTLYLSGQVGNLPGEMRLVEGGVGPETRQAMENVRDVLEANGASLDDVAKCTLILADIADWKVASDVYREFFPRNLPARSGFASHGLALGARVEVECIAWLGER